MGVIGGGVRRVDGGKGGKGLGISEYGKHGMGRTVDIRRGAERGDIGCDAECGGELRRDEALTERSEVCNRWKPVFPFSYPVIAIACACASARASTSASHFSPISVHSLHLAQRVSLPLPLSLSRIHTPRSRTESLKTMETCALCVIRKMQPELRGSIPPMGVSILELVH